MQVNELIKQAESILMPENLRRASARADSSGNVIMPWDSVELTAEEAFNALRAAKLDKWTVEQEAEKRKRRVAAEIEARRMWTADEMFQYIQWYGYEILNLSYLDEDKNEHKGLKIDEVNIHVLEALCAYYVRDEALFQKIGLEHFGEYGKAWNIHKGLYIWGGVGTGKTTMLKLFQINKRLCFDIFRASIVTNQYAGSKNSVDGMAVVRQFGIPMYNPSNDIERYFQKQRGIAIDDLGTETIPVHCFGNKRNVWADILLSRYEQCESERMSWDATQITSNLTPKEVYDFYGDRVKDRFRKMFNIVELSGASRRY